MVSHRRVDIKGILADPELRRKLMVSTIQAIQAREGIETTEEQAVRAYLRARAHLSTKCYYSLARE